jgi:hypothetical protein
MRRHAAVVLASLVLASGACNETGQEPITLPLHVAGTDLSTPVAGAFGATVRVERAELAFGPLYLCAGNTAGDLCDAARLEWLGTTVVDLADPAAQRAGDLDGTTGVVRSFMYDLGISSQLTRQDAVVLDAATELGGYSIVVEGIATVSGVDVPFRAAVAVLQTDDTELGVPVIRKSSSDVFTHDVTPGDAGLLVRFDARAWLESVDFRAFVEDASCAPEGSPIVCAGLVEQTCSPDGAVLATRDCDALGQVCVAGSGCESRVQVSSESEVHRALRNAVTSGSRPTFAWSAEPSPSNEDQNQAQEK